MLPGAPPVETDLSKLILFGFFNRLITNYCISVSMFIMDVLNGLNLSTSYFNFKCCYRKFVELVVQLQLPPPPPNKHT